LHVIATFSESSSPMGFFLIAHTEKQTGLCLYL